MRIMVNGQEQALDEGATVAVLVARFNVEPRYVAVEVNNDLVPRRNYGQTPLKDGDRVEIVTLVGGG